MTSPLILPPQGIRTFPSPESFVQRGTSPLNVLYTGAANQTALSTGAFAVDNVHAHPFLIGAGGVIDSLSLEVTSGAASGVARIGIYKNQSDTVLYPSVRVVSSGELDTSASGVKTASGLSAPVAPGLYWAVAHFGGASVTYRAFLGGSKSHVLGITSGFVRNTRLSGSETYAALPASFYSGLTPDVNSSLVIAVHFA